jgi:hypothetical protein
MLLALGQGRLLGKDFMHNVKQPMVAHHAVSMLLCQPLAPKINSQIVQNHFA